MDTSWKLSTKLGDVLTQSNLVDLALPSTDTIFFCDHRGRAQDSIYDVVNLPEAQKIVLPHQEDLLVSYEDMSIDRWQLIVMQLSENIASLFELIKAIKTYNGDVLQSQFDVLQDYVRNYLDEQGRSNFYGQLLPAIIRLALELPTLFPRRLRRLSSTHPGVLFLTKHQISCLLANSFLCTFTELTDFQTLNFDKIFSSNGCPPARRVLKLEKLKCFVNYLRQVTQSEPFGFVSFELKTLYRTNMWPKLEQCDRSICQLTVRREGTIDREGADYAQVDFANKYIGGGVLNTGCVQEEILFATSPELIAARLFCDRLYDTDAVVVTGCEKYSRHIGYSDTFRWRKSQRDGQQLLERDKYNRPKCEIIAIDATSYGRNVEQQYSKEKIDREICKAIVGFAPEAFLKAGVERRLATIATGNWGCGVYSGDHYLKALVQLLAASYHGRDLLYFTFGDEELAADLENVSAFLHTRPHLSVADLYGLVLEFANLRKANSKFNLVSFLYQKL